MLNKEALEAGLRAAVKRMDETSGIPDWRNRARQVGQDALEAYHAALPDEDGLVKELRGAALRAHNAYLTDLFEEAADALEAARAAIPEGWRLVPKEPTDEWIQGLASQMNWSVLYQKTAKEWIGKILAAAPETSDDR